MVKRMEEADYGTTSDGDGWLTHRRLECLTLLLLLLLVV